MEVVRPMPERRHPTGLSPSAAAVTDRAFDDGNPDELLLTDEVSVIYSGSCRYAATLALPAATGRAAILSLERLPSRL